MEQPNKFDTFIIDSPKTRKTVQIWLYFTVFLCFLGALGVLAVGIWALRQNFNMVFPLLLFFSAFFCAILSLWIFLFSFKNTKVIGNEIRHFTGFRRFSFYANERSTVLIAISGRSDRTLSWCLFIYSCGELVRKCELVEPSFWDDQKEAEYKNRIEQILLSFGKKTGCAIKFEWDKAIEMDRR